MVCCCIRYMFHIRIAACHMWVCCLNMYITTAIQLLAAVKCGCIPVHLQLNSITFMVEAFIIMLECPVWVLHSTPCDTPVLQLSKFVPQRQVQLTRATCNDPTLADHSFPGGHHMVCLHWEWLLCGPHSPA